MNMINLLKRQNALECEAAELKKHFSLNDKDDRLRYAALQKEIQEIEAGICAMIKAIDSDSSNDYSAVTESFADSINKAAEKGIPIEDVIFGKDTILDLRTLSCMFRIVCEGGERTVIGGQLSAQCKKFPWLLINITGDGLDGDPIWHIPCKISRPNLSHGIGCGYHLDGSYQREVLAFFQREYARQMNKEEGANEDPDLA